MTWVQGTNKLKKEYPHGNMKNPDLLSGKTAEIAKAVATNQGEKEQYSNIHY